MAHEQRGAGGKRGEGQQRGQGAPARPSAKPAPARSPRVAAAAADLAAHEARLQAAPTEEAFLAAYDPSAYSRPSLAVDVAVVTVEEGRVLALLYRRARHPGRGLYALPGGFVRIDESLEDAVTRLLAEKSGLRGIFTEQLYTFGAVGRDPRTRVVSVVYMGLVAAARLRAVEQGADTVLATLEVDWPGETGGPVGARAPGGHSLPLFLDHADILGVAVKRLRGKLDYTPIGFQLLPESFTLRELQEVHEAIRQEPLNKDSFRRRMLATGYLEATGEREREVAYRPAELYRFVRRSAV